MDGILRDNNPELFGAWDQVARHAVPVLDTHASVRPNFFAAGDVHLIEKLLCATVTRDVQHQRQVML
jgi:hypothetical protein